MKVNIRQAKITDNLDLCHLDSSCTQGQRIVFHYQRKDFFARSRIYDKWAVFIAEVEKKIVGMVAVCLKKIRIQGRLSLAGYIYDLRIAPAWRGKGIVGRLIRKLDKYLHRSGVEYAYTYVLNENKTAYRISRFLGLFEVGQYKILIFPVHRNTHSISKLESQEEQRVLKRIEADLAAYDFTEKYALARRFKNTDSGSPFKGIFSLKNNKEIAVCVYDSSVLAAKIVDRIPFALKLLALGGSFFTNIFKLPHLPAKNKPLIIWNLYNFWQDKLFSDKGAVLELIRAIQSYAYNRKVHMLMIHLDVRDPLLPLLKSAARYTMQGKILMRTKKWGQTPPQLHKIFLDIRDF